jgi:alkylhydroperoxidase family enzyme
MSNFAPVNPDSATGNAAELLAQVQKSVGQAPNMTKVMANSPALLKSWLVLSGAVAGGALPAAVRERLAISTAQLNGCEYCLSAHTYTSVPISPRWTPPSSRARARVIRTTHT